MAIEVTSVPDSRRFISVRRLLHFFKTLPHNLSLATRSLIVRSVLGLVILTLIAAGDSLVRSYKYYSHIIDARLASGYLTSRPGLYAAPRVLRVGQKLSHDKLINTLRRAGYVESAASDVWSGSFNDQPSVIQVRPSRTNRHQPKVVKVSFSGDEISELTGDDISLDSFTLEPEVLSNDLSSKGGKREILTYGDLPPVMVKAILSIEDHRFFEHSGVDIAGLTRALLRNAGDERLGQGGSTITQQLVKNTYLSPEKTFRRKYAEAMLSIALERRLSKQDILALYCNEIYLGQRGAVAVRGVKEAAEVFFGKELKDVSLAEAATLAGMIQGPARYSPLRHPEAAQARRNMVLEAMLREGVVTDAQAKVAASEAVKVASPSNDDNSLAPYFVDYVNRVAESDFDTSG